MTSSIRLLTASDAEAYFEHLSRHMGESGQDGDFIFTPSDGYDQLNKPKELERFREKWDLSLDEPGWTRTWGVFVDGQIRGHIDLRGGYLKSALHRVSLAMGLERSLRQQGLGGKLIELALNWLRETPSIEWVDLYVFANNHPAQKLYSRFGFRETGRVVDLFRLHGEAITDIHMVLKLERATT
jgi:putative acetyltransferase